MVKKVKLTAVTAVLLLSLCNCGGSHKSKAEEMNRKADSTYRADSARVQKELEQKYR